MVNSVARAAEVLFFVSKSKCGSTLSDVSSQLDIPKSTAFNIIHTLSEKRLLTITDARQLTVVLGPGIYELAFNEISGSDTYSIVQPELAALSAKLKKSTAFYQFSNDAYSLLCISPYPGTPYPNATVGQSIDVRTGLYGPVCLSVCAHRKSELTHGIRPEQAKRLCAHMERIRSRGYDMLTCDHLHELYSLVVPVQGIAQSCLGFICVYLLQPDTADAAFGGMVQTLQKAASDMGTRLALLA